MQYYWKIMLKGLAVVLPVLITAYVVYWVITTMELLVGGLLKFFFLGSIYVPGMGIVVGLGILFMAGILMERSGLIQKLYGLVDRLLERIPLVKSLYGALRDLMQFFSSDDGGKKMDKVVLVTFSEHFRLIGFATGRTLDLISETPAGEESVAVFFPMSYQLGGFTVYVPRSLLQPLDMTVEEAMVMAVTGGMAKNRG
jgi:uncharacterized membrane protein